MTAPSVWQEVEFGAYSADLPFWVELAVASDGPVLELGAGAGRVALHLAGRGHDVIALERDPDLAAELQLAAAEREVSITIVAADLASPDDLRLPRRPALVIGPLHVIQVLDAEARPLVLGRLLELSAPGATMALTVVDESTLLSAGAASTQILPDMRELDGWVYSSEPLWVQVSDEALTVRRLRERVSPSGQMERAVHDEILHRLEPEALEREATEVGFLPMGRQTIRSGESEADSILVLLGAPR